MPSFDKIFLFVLPAIPYALPFGIAWLIVTLLQTGDIPFQGWIIDREDNPRGYWAIIAALSFACALLLTLLLFPDWSLSVAKAIGFIS